MYYENAKCFISKIYFLESTKDHGSDLMRKIFVSLVNPTDIKIFSSSPNWNRQHSRQLDQICCFIQDISVKTKITIHPMFHDIIYLPDSVHLRPPRLSDHHKPLVVSVEARKQTDTKYFLWIF